MELKPDHCHYKPGLFAACGGHPSHVTLCHCQGCSGGRFLFKIHLLRKLQTRNMSEQSSSALVGCYQEAPVVLVCSSSSPASTSMRRSIWGRPLMKSPLKRYIFFNRTKKQANIRENIVMRNPHWRLLLLKFLHKRCFRQELYYRNLLQ